MGKKVCIDWQVEFFRQASTMAYNMFSSFAKPNWQYFPQGNPSLWWQLHLRDEKFFCDFWETVSYGRYHIDEMSCGISSVDELREQAGLLGQLCRVYAIILYKNGCSLQLPDVEKLSKGSSSQCMSWMSCALQAAGCPESVVEALEAGVPADDVVA